MSVDGWRNISVLLEAQTAPYVSGLRRAAVATREFATEVQAAGEKAAVAFNKTSALERFGSKMTRGVTLPIVAAGLAAVKLGYDFDGAMAHVASAMGVPASSLKGLGNDLLDIAAKTGAMPTELANALIPITQAGFRGKAALDIVTIAAEASKAGLGDLEGVANAVTSVMHSYAGTGLTVARTMDILTAAHQEGRISVADLGTSMGKVLPIAAHLGIGFEQIAGSLAFLSRNGSPTQAIMAMTQVVQQLDKITPGSAKKLAAVGSSVAGLKAEIADKGLMPALQDMADRLGGVDKLKEALFTDKRAGAGIDALFGKDGGAAAAASIDKANHSLGLFANVWDSFSKSDQSKIQRALASLAADGVRLGRDLLPVVASLIGDVSKLVGIFDDLSGSEKVVVESLIGLVAAIGPTIKIIGLVERIHAGMTKLADSKLAAGAFDGFRLGLQGVTEEGAGAGNAIGSMIESVGGLGVVLPGAAIAVGVLAAAYIDMAGEAHRAKQNVDDLVASAQQNGGSIAKGFQEKLANTLVGRSGGFNLNISGDQFRYFVKTLKINAADLSHALLGSGKDYDAFVKRLRDSGRLKDAGQLAQFIGQLDSLRGSAGHSRQQIHDLNLIGKQLGLTEAELGTNTDKVTGAHRRGGAAAESYAEKLRDVNLVATTMAQGAKAQFDTNQQLAADQKAVTQATADYATTVRSTAQAVSQAHQTEVQAERSLASAQRSTLEAQRALSQARIDAVLNLRNLHNATVDAALGERGAVLSLAQAREQLAALPLDATDLQRQQAQLAVDQAQQALVEAGQAKGDATSAEARAPLQNAINLANAQQAVNDAVTAEGDARRGVADAARASQQAQVDADKAVKDAADKVHQAQITYLLDLEAEAETHSRLSLTVVAGLDAVKNKLDANDPLRKNLDAYIKSLLLAIQAANVLNGTTVPTTPGTAVPPARNPDAVGGNHGVGTTAASAGQQPVLEAPRMLMPATNAPRAIGGRGGSLDHQSAAAIAEIVHSARGAMADVSSKARSTTNIYTSDAKSFWGSMVFDS